MRWGLFLASSDVRFKVMGFRDTPLFREHFLRHWLLSPRTWLVRFPPWWPVAFLLGQRYKNVAKTMKLCYSRKDFFLATYSSSLRCTLHGRSCDPLASACIQPSGNANAVCGILSSSTFIGFVIHQVGSTARRGQLYVTPLFTTLHFRSRSRNICLFVLLTVDTSPSHLLPNHLRTTAIAHLQSWYRSKA